MVELPDYVHDNLHKLFIGFITVLIVILPLGIYGLLHLPKIDFPSFSKKTKQVSSTKTKIDQKETKTKEQYTNPTNKYSLSYPLNWDKMTAEPSELYTDELFYAKDATPSANVVSNTIGVRVMESVGTEWDSAKAYFDELLRQPMGENVFEHGRIIKLANVKVDNTPAVMQVEESITPEGLPYFTKNVYVYKNGKLYVLMNSGVNQETVEKYDPAFNLIVGSFKFL